MTPEERADWVYGKIGMGSQTPTADRAMIAAEIRAAEIRAVAETTRWIPVSERLPEPRINVLCWHQDYRAPHDPARADAWVGSWEECDGVWCFLDGFGIEIRTVTHWQPLPPAPTEASE